MLLQIQNRTKDMNSEVVRNFKMHMRDYQNEGKKVVTQYVFTCRNCSHEISIPGGGGGETKVPKFMKSIESGSTEKILSLHLMTCEKYQQSTPSSSSSPARAI